MATLKISIGVPKPLNVRSAEINTLVIRCIDAVESEIDKWQYGRNGKLEVCFQTETSWETPIERQH